MGIYNDGQGTIVSLADGVTLKEKEVTPPGLDGGGANDTTTMRNSVFRTMQPKKLKTVTELNFTAAFDKAAYTSLLSQINVNQLITVTFPDTGTISFWGWLNTFKPNAFKEGEQPTAECQIIPSNQNSSGVETAPVVG